MQRTRKDKEIDLKMAIDDVRVMLSRVEKSIDDLSDEKIIKAIVELDNIDIVLRKFWILK